LQQVVADDPTTP